MKYFFAVLILSIAFVKPNYALFSLGESEINGRTDKPESAPARNATSLAKSIYYYPGRRYLHDYEDGYVSWYVPYHNFNIRPVRINNRIGLAPEFGSGIVEIKRTRPVEQHFYKIFIRDSPSFRLNHFVHTGGFQSDNFRGAFDRSSNGTNASAKDGNKTLLYGTVLHEGVFSESPRRGTVEKDPDETEKKQENQNETDKFRSDTSKNGAVGEENIAEGFVNDDEMVDEGYGNRSVPVPKGGNLNWKLLPKDEKAVKKVIDTIDYGLLGGKPQGENDMETHNFKFKGGAGTQPNKTEIRIQIVKLSSQFYGEPYHEIPSDIHKAGTGLETDEKIDQEGPKSELIPDYNSRDYGTVFKTEHLSHEPSHIMKLPKTNRDPVYSGKDDAEERTGLSDPTAIVYPNYYNIKIFSPDQTPAITPSTINLQKTTTETVKTITDAMYYYHRGLNMETSPVPGEGEKIFHGNLTPRVYSEKITNGAETEDSSSKQPAPTIPTSIVNRNKIYTLEDLLNWRKGFRYPLYGRHSSGEIVRRKMILDLKSGRLNNVKSFSEEERNGGYRFVYSKKTDKPDKILGKRQFPPAGAEANCRRGKKSIKADGDFIQDYAYDYGKESDDFPDI